MTLKQVIEALVFASPKPLLTKEIVAALRSAGEETENQEAIDFAKTKDEDAIGALEELKADYEQAGHAFALAEQINGWTLITTSGAAHWVRQLYPEAKPTRLSGPALETLAIIAYRQPVTRADIEAVRGVAVDGVMQVLLDRSLVKIAGRSEAPGRPLLYSTTEYFLQHFGLKTVTDLPNSDELRRIPLPTAPTPEGSGKATKEDAVPQPTDAAPEKTAEAPPGAASASEIATEVPESIAEPTESAEPPPEVDAAHETETHVDGAETGPEPTLEPDESARAGTSEEAESEPASE